LKIVWQLQNNTFSTGQPQPVFPSEARHLQHENQNSTMSDTAIRTAIENTPALHQFPIRIQVKDGIVTLHGTVSSNSHRRAAFDAIRPLTGVQGIKNCISVFPAES